MIDYKKCKHYYKDGGVLDSSMCRLMDRAPRVSCCIHDSESAAIDKIELLGIECPKFEAKEVKIETGKCCYSCTHGITVLNDRQIDDGIDCSRHSVPISAFDVCEDWKTKE